MSYEALAIILAAIAAGSFFKGAIGIGLPIIAVPALATFLGVEHAVVVIIVPAFLTNIWIVWRYRRMAVGVPHLPISLIAASVGTVIGTFILVALTDKALLWLLIVWVAAYLVNLLINPNFKLEGRTARIFSPIIAGLAGLSQGSTGIGGPVVATWIHSYRLESQVYVFAASIMFLAISGTQFFSVAGFGLFTDTGLFTQERFLQGLLAVIPATLFVQLGMWTTPYISAKWFNRMVIAIVCVMEVKMIWQVMGS
jgi:hypothetical protein